LGTYQKTTVVYDLESGVPEEKPSHQQKKNFSCDENYRYSSAFSLLICKCRLTCAEGNLTTKKFEA
jgi:hypothetical protein